MQTFRAFLSRQLGFPAGWFGRLLLRSLNRNNAAMNDLVLQELQLQFDDLILEIGFGGGDLIHKTVKTGLPCQIVGVERSPDALKVCQQRFRSWVDQGKVNLHLADAVDLPFPDRSFNQVCTVNTIYFWSDPPQVLTECHRVLVSGGKLVLGYTSKADLEEKKLSQHGFTAYEVAEVEMLLRSAGFGSIRTVSGQSDRHSEFFCTSGVAVPESQE